jgi:hypothetical protein
LNLKISFKYEDLKNMAECYEEVKKRDIKKGMKDIRKERTVNFSLYLIIELD